jgi:drug/metabolite transporter (DMT)-like permease
MWVVMALISGGAYTVSGLLTRHVLRKKQDAWAFSFVFSLMGALVSLPLMWWNYQGASSLSLWGLMVGVGGLIVIHNYLNFSASNYLEASLVGVITKFRLVWVFGLGVVILGEVFEWQKVAGLILTLMSGWLIVRKFRKPDKIRGVLLAVSATAVYAAVVLAYKYLFREFNTATLTFFIFMIPAVINMLVMPNFGSRVTKLCRENGAGVILAGVVGGVANLSMNQALNWGEISRVPVIIEAFMVVTLVGEHYWLKETSYARVKLVAAMLALVGAMLIRL